MTTISLCVWHAICAFAAYMMNNNQCSLMKKHFDLNYANDDSTRKWNANFLNSNWVKKMNHESKAKFRKTFIRMYWDSSKEFKKTINAKKKVYIENKNLWLMFTELFKLHLYWHLVTHLPSNDNFHNSKRLWIEQTQEMHYACQRNWQLWLWKYVWKHWYHFSRWLVWARSIYTKISIINSNSIIKSM